VLLGAPVSAGAVASEATAARVGSAPSAEQVLLVLPLAARTRALRRFALALTTVGSPQYAEYESIPQLARRFGASARTGQRVVRYLRAAGATHVAIDATRLFADATVSVSLAHRLFVTSLAEFRNPDGARFTAPAGGVSVPKALRGLVTGVVGLDTKEIATAPSLLHKERFVTALGENPVQGSSGYRPATGTSTGCASARSTDAFTPDQYLTAYGYDSLHQSRENGEGERVALIEIVGFKGSDVSTFARCFSLPLPAINRFDVGIIKPLAPAGESTYDLEMLDAAAPRLKAIDVYESSSDAAEILRALAAPLHDSLDKPEVISASLGMCEPFTKEAIGKSGLATVEGTLEEAAASGITFLASSGDEGSADCIPGPTMLPQSPLPELAVSYPASSWWSTGVGGTNMQLNAHNDITAQVVWNDATAGTAGGGGASQIFSRPPYQDGTVTANVRAVPDVSMLADVAPGYAVYCSAALDCVNSSNTNPWQSVGGTSLATPLLAGGFALVDQVLREHKHQDLGLANPLLYKIGRSASLARDMFDDVTSGSNDVGPFITAGTPLGCCSATLGFDEASGWGSVNMTAFAGAALSFQPKSVNVHLSLPGNQHPAHAKHILVTVSCSQECLMRAQAKVTIDHRKPFTAGSGLYRLSRSGPTTVKITFSASQLEKLRSALSEHASIFATISATIVNPTGTIQHQTASKTLKISS
jgi:kumamolisin